MLVGEFTLTENLANTTTSQLRAVCHANDSVILGTWLQETDHRTIEDQVSIYRYFAVSSINQNIKFMAKYISLPIVLFFYQVIAPFAKIHNVQVYD